MHYNACLNAPSHKSQVLSILLARRPPLTLLDALVRGHTLCRASVSNATTLLQPLVLEAKNVFLMLNETHLIKLANGATSRV